jgi:hypothetical protein
LKAALKSLFCGKLFDVKKKLILLLPLKVRLDLLHNLDCSSPLVHEFASVSLMTACCMMMTINSASFEKVSIEGKTFDNLNSSIFHPKQQSSV